MVMSRLQCLAESSEEPMQRAETQHEIQLAMFPFEGDARIQLNILSPDWDKLECTNCRKGRCKQSCPGRHKSAESQMRQGVRELCEAGRLWSALRLV